MIGAPLDGTKSGGVLKGVELWNNLDQYALTDRIINIRFNRRRRPGDTNDWYFVIRSDYEAAFNNDGSPHFVTMKQKPTISVSYKQVSSGVAIEVNVRVANLFFNNMRDGDSIFNNAERPIESMVIQMGYRRQFPNWTVPPLSSDVAGEPNRLDLFNSMDNFQIDGVPDLMDSGLQLTVRVLTVQPEGLPPDRVLYFQGIVGNLRYGLNFTSPGDLEPYLTAPENFPTDTTFADLSPLEKLLFTQVTSRFLRPGVRYELDDNRYSADFVDGETKIEQSLLVFDYDAANSVMFTAEQQKGKPLDERWGEPIELVNGILKPADAKQLGIACYVSPKLRETSKAVSAALASPNPEIRKAAAEKGMAVSVGFKDTLGAQLTLIRDNAFPSMIWVQRPNGDFFLYDRSESLAKVVLDEKFSAAEREKRPIMLPAIYDITITGLRIIRCPFISIIAPGQLIGFTSKYNIADLVGYYYPHKENRWYRAIIISVEFSTTEDANMMSIECVDADAPETSSSATQTPAEIGSSEAARSTALKWEDYTIAQRDSWQGLAKKYIFDNPAVRGTPDVEGIATIADAVALLLENNADAVTDFQARGGNGKEKNAPALAGLDPWPPILYAGDAVKVPTGVG